MVYQLLADLVLLLHAAFILFVVLGGLLVWRWPRLAWVQLPAAAWGTAIAMFGWYCPLTPLENHWRRLAGQQGYDTGFIQHYLLSFIYPEGLTRPVQVAMGLGVIVITGVIYALLWRRHR
ncbi:MAG: DUF2784 domain-containing protein [Pseudomonadota bacterium]